MKNILKYTIIAASTIFTFSCGEDYLEKTPSEVLTTAQIGDAASRNPAVIAGTMNGIYALMFEVETGGTTGADDFGHKGYDIFADMLSSDVALSVSTYGWYRASITEFQCTEDFTFTDNYQVWRYYYRIIRSANTVIDALGGNDVTPELDENKYIMGQAKAIRAHSYFYLAQYFQKTYNPTEEILPLYDDLLDQNGPKVPASEIYALIESDLTAAISLLNGFTRSAKSQINQDVAKGILAYVYGAMGRDSDVKTLTSQVISTGAYPIMNEEEVLGGFNDVNTPGWMWGVDLTSDNEISLHSWWGQMDYFSYSYAGYGDSKAIDSDLYALIPADDVRKEQFESDPAAGNQYLQPLNKFYEAARVPRGSSTTITSDLIYMRIAEMYILNAEAAAKTSDEATAKSSLKALVSKRVPDASYIDALTGQALLNEIYLQSRIELWGEGKTYLAMKRNKRTIKRGDNHLSFVGEEISYDDERMTFEIPEAEILYNPFISTQND
ncbi:RagB/SusD family nutrient uptake outer membrane protein [Aestuariibaculum suncheonense]|uniref:RagB/SusD family nutrient uptake outer membrane protein n=1 Tax=Aestuariibaculum suncheonense TaxID=1028745 RepID=A0A8J6Q591_9FLAO|nr:RagB/SusD family nutrient uptake outer membrane protein [Aestuariibaculum suncheonense]MBD0834311.1 RagB/SusD family nutrient uptake outer membrane protein [Aestuariibaculum suncheonense]